MPHSLRAKLKCLNYKKLITDRELERLCTALDNERQTGKWIDYSDEGYVECPYCQHATTCDDNIDELHYCFYCGAKMESEESNEDDYEDDNEFEKAVKDMVAEYEPYWKKVIAIQCDV